MFTSIKDCSSEIDILFSLGGDGTFLDSVAHVERTNIPIAGINFGRLGFLANISIPEMSGALEQIVAGKYQVEKRSMLQVESDAKYFAPFPFGLNDFTIQKSGAGLLKINTFINDEYMSTYWTDGLIVATPTGSTAYSLSVGGPIITPSLSTFIISAIAPHNLTVRPLVIPDSSTIRFEASGRNGKVLLTIDSRDIVSDSPIVVTVKKAPFSANVVSLESTAFYKTLRSKLYWGIDKRN